MEDEDECFEWRQNPRRGGPGSRVAWPHRWLLRWSLVPWFWNLLYGTEVVTQAVQLLVREEPRGERRRSPRQVHLAGLGPWSPRRPGAYSTFQMAILPSSGPEPLSTYLSSAEHRVRTASACATSSFSTALRSALTT